MADNDATAQAAHPVAVGVWVGPGGQVADLMATQLGQDDPGDGDG
jgi:hypothetical protein